MASNGEARLTDLLSSTSRLALVGLAKNTGKTVTLGAILAEHAAAGLPIGVTSIGRDGEAHDVLDARIDKPRVELVRGSLVASTRALLRASGVAHEVLLATGVRTPLGEVVVARLTEQGTVEVAGPGAADDVRDVGEAMAALGAEQVLIDGAVDRRAASSPAVADGLVMATGAVLGEDIEQVVASTRDAVDLVRLPHAGEINASAELDEPEQAGAGRAVAGAEAGEAAGQIAGQIALPRRLVLNGEPGDIAALLGEQPHASTLLVDGALSERFLEGLIAARRERAGRELRVIVQDPTKVFLSRRGPSWYRHQGISLEALRTIELKAITVNPVAPLSHQFESELLRTLVEQAVGDVPVLDVLDPSYLALAK